MNIVFDNAQLVENVEKEWEGKKYRNVKFQGFRGDGGLDVLALSADLDCPGLAGLEQGKSGQMELTVEAYLGGQNGRTQKIRLLSVKNGKAPVVKA